ncbi:EMP1 protein, partial [Mystacornis crossleyi]|nr:EMP1 protein [Mystacornis crossleyi]
MLVLLAGIFVVHIATVIMLFVSTIANVSRLPWIGHGFHLPQQQLALDTAGRWTRGQSLDLLQSILCVLTASLKAVQAFMILSIIFSVVALVLFIMQLFTLEKGKRFYMTGAVMLVCWMCILIAVSIYTARFTGKVVYSTNPHHGYCFILAWICFCFSFIIGILYLVLRKK